MPPWLPARAFIDYVTGAFLVVAGVCFLLARKTRIAAAYLGAWIVLLVVVIYGPVLIGALADPSPGVQVEGVNYFADTLLFGGAILSLAGANTEFPVILYRRSGPLRGAITATVADAGGFVLTFCGDTTPFTAIAPAGSFVPLTPALENPAVRLMEFPLLPGASCGVSELPLGQDPCPPPDCK